MHSFLARSGDPCTLLPQSTDANWMDVVWCLVRDDADASKTRAAAGQAVDLVLVELVLCLIAQSASVMYR